MRALFAPLAVMVWMAYAASSLGAPLGSTNLDAARIQGSNSLAKFQGVITPLNFRLMGFDSFAEVPLATNGEPLLVCSIPLARLKNFQATNDFRVLIRPDPGVDPVLLSLQSRVIVPLMVSSDVRSAMILRVAELAPIGQAVRWTNLSWGHAELIRRLVDTYTSIPPAQLRPGWAPFAVEIPIFDIWFVGYLDVQSKLVLVATSDLDLGPVVVQRHEVVPVGAMYLLHLAALRYNGMPN